MALKALACTALVLGALIVLSNWYSIYASRSDRRFVSPIPVVGGALVTLGLLGFTTTRPYAWIGFVADYGTLVFIFSLPVILRNAWRTSSINLLHGFSSDHDGRRHDIRLFKRSVFTIRCKHDPPIPCDDHGSLVVEYGFVGRWHEQDDGFCLGSYDSNRSLEIRRSGEGYRTIETDYPPDRQNAYDSLDSLPLKKAR